MAKVHNSKRLAESKVLITGATSGLGFRISIALAQEGAEVIAIGRDKKRLEELFDAIEQTTGSATLVCIDLANQGTIEELSNKISEKFGKLDVIIHCAMSSLQMMPISQVSVKEVEINLLSPIMISFRLILCFHKLLSRDPKGLFMYISDFEQKSLMAPTIQQKACDQLFLSYQEENKRLGVERSNSTPRTDGNKVKKEGISR